MGNFNPDTALLALYDLYDKSAYFKLGLVVFLIFLFIFLMGLVRKHVFKLSMRGAFFGFALGVVLMILLDLVIIMGLADRGKMQDLFSGEKRQEAVGEVLVSGFANLGGVLGVKTVIPPREPQTAEEVTGNVLSLPREETQKVKDLLCP